MIHPRHPTGGGFVSAAGSFHVFVTGDITLTTDRGMLFSKDAITLSTSGNGEFAEVDTVIGGVGEWAGYSGKFSATGTYLGGSGSGVYSGLLCAP